MHRLFTCSMRAWLLLRTTLGEVLLQRSKMLLSCQNESNFRPALKCFMICIPKLLWLGSAAHLQICCTCTWICMKNLPHSTALVTCAALVGPEPSSSKDRCRHCAALNPSRSRQLTIADPYPKISQVCIHTRVSSYNTIAMQYNSMKYNKQMSRDLPCNLRELWQCVSGRGSRLIRCYAECELAG